MFAKIYFYAWITIAAIAGVFYVTGNMSALAIVVFGMVAFGMTFMGMMNVLPSVIAHKTEERIQALDDTAVQPATLTIPNGARTIRV